MNKDTSSTTHHPQPDYESDDHHRHPHYINYDSPFSQDINYNIHHNTNNNYLLQEEYYNHLYTPNYLLDTLYPMDTLNNNNQQQQENNNRMEYFSQCQQHSLNLTQGYESLTTEHLELMPTIHLPVTSSLPYVSSYKPKLLEPKKQCSNCLCIETPSWRRCPKGERLLCNACGLYEKLHNIPRPTFRDQNGYVKVKRSRKFGSELKH
ncbi:hypothetical protein K502DRAFT_365863 [Neoconidiobolus thromboides FSU 785]|nr:hypothetical protein K502DRAFT_365863 [Neoconidiobolus thromboides FSU 785]